MAEVRVPVRVKPGSSRAKVGGRYGEDQLVVAVNAPPVEGAANAAVIAAMAKALAVRPRQVSIIGGLTSRSKIVAIEVPDDEVTAMRDRANSLLD